MPDENDIQKLLRLKRYEQPGEDYFNGFLHEFHRRQRAEMLRQPAWKVALERMQLFFGGGVGFERFAYSGAVAAVLAIASAVSVNILKEPAAQPAQARLAGVQMSAPATLSMPDIYVTAPVQRAVPAAAPAAVRQTYPVAFSRPSYVMDVRPASYELPSSF
jgi:hypothetical protein